MMDLGQLRSFVEVAERGTIAAAATALDFTGPAISQHISKLEAELGAKLFDRVGGRLRLSDAGAALMPVARQMLDLDFHGRDVVSRRPSRPHYVVAGFASALRAIVLPLLPTEAEMTLDVIEREDADALRDLRVGAVDVVLTQEYDGFPVQRDQRLHFTEVLRDELRLVGPSSMPASTTLDDLQDTTWLLNGHGTRCSAATSRLLDAAGVSPRVGGTVADNDTLLALVAAGHGVTIVPDLVLDGQRPDLTVCAQELGVSRTILAVHRVVAAPAIKPLLGRIMELEPESAAPESIVARQ